MADSTKNTADEARERAAQYHTQAPVESQTHGMEREPTVTSLSEDIRAKTNHPHKGDVGRPETNEDIYQGSKMRQID